MKDLRNISLDDLAVLLRMEREQLDSLAQKAPLLYRERKQLKKSGEYRLIEAPHDPLIWPQIP